MRPNNLTPEMRFTRVVFGLIMIASAFVPWGRWVVMVLGILFLFSARSGFCVTCELYRRARETKEGRHAT